MQKRITERNKKITATVALAVAVLIFFIWLGAGMAGSVPAEEREGIWPMFILYAAFPIIVGVGSFRRVRELVRIGKEDAVAEEKSEQDSGEELKL